MTGQDMISSVKTFDEAIQLTGVIMTKLDGDSRGGAALSIRSVTGVPIKFVGVSEKYDGLEDFNAKQIADRILGFGDVVSLVDRVEKVVKAEDVASLEQKIANNSFDFNDFRAQIHQMQKIGSMTELIGMIPGISRKIKGLSFDENQIVWTEAIINSMTPNERTKPEIINASRKKRIALAGVTTLPLGPPTALASATVPPWDRSNCTCRCNWTPFGHSKCTCKSNCTPLGQVQLHLQVQLVP